VTSWLAWKPVDIDGHGVYATKRAASSKAP
jgi:hypothetical protein